MKSNEYWMKRQRANKLKIIKLGENNISELKKLMLLNLLNVRKDIREYYKRYGEELNEKLSPKEFKQYKKQIKENAKKYPKDKVMQRILREDAPKYKIERLRQFETQLQTQLSEITALQETGVKSALTESAKLSDELLLATIQGGTNMVFNSIPEEKLLKIVNSTWIGGSNWSEKIWKDRIKLGKKLTKVLSIGVPEGYGMQKMARELSAIMGQTFSNSFRLIRTEASHIDGQVTLDRYKEIQRELDEDVKYRYDAFLDSRTSEICQELDNQIFDLDKAEVGVNYPPMHPNCRSTTNLVVI